MEDKKEREQEEGDLDLEEEKKRKNVKKTAQAITAMRSAH